ncbi:MAG: hypothetical protein WCA35_22090, partial [Kovacikia sp.]
DEQIEQFLENVYMKKRIHSSLSYLTPDEYEKKWNEQQKRNVIQRKNFLKVFDLLSEFMGSLQDRAQTTHLIRARGRVQ